MTIIYNKYFFILFILYYLYKKFQLTNQKT